MKFVKSKGIQPLLVLLDFPSALLSNKGALLLKQRFLLETNLIKWRTIILQLVFDFVTYSVVA